MKTSIFLQSGLLVTGLALMAITLQAQEVKDALSQPTIPEHFRYGNVEIGFAPSWIGMGHVVAFKNQYSVILSNCYFAVEGSRNQEGRAYYGPIRLAEAFKPGKTLKVGWLELGKHWVLLPGDVVYLRCDNLPESKWTLPTTHASTLAR